MSKGTYVYQDGLVHISQIYDKFIRHPINILSVGGIRKVKIVDIDVKKGRISLSMRDIDGDLCKSNNYDYYIYEILLFSKAKKSDKIYV